MAGIRTENKIYEVGIYCRLSKDDGTENESASIATQENICQGGFHPKDEIPPINWNLLFREERKDSFTDCLVFIIMNIMRAV